MNSIFPSSRPNIAVRVVPKIPATMVGVGGIGISKKDGVWTVEPSWEDLALIAPGILLDPTTKELWVRDPVTDAYYRMTLGGLGRALFWGTSSTPNLIGVGSRTFTTQSGKDWLPGMFVQAFSTSVIANYVIGQVTAYVGTELTINIIAIGGSGTPSDWTIVQSTLPGSGPPGSAGLSGGLNFNFVASTSGDPGAGGVGFNNAVIGAITEMRISDIDRNGVDVSAGIQTWDDSTTLTHRARIRVYDPDSPAKFVNATIIGPAVDGGAFTTFPLGEIVGTTLPDVGSCQVEVYRTGDMGIQGPPGLPGGVVHMSDTPPVAPIHGQEWFETDTGATYIYYDDGTSQQWIQTNGDITDVIEEAPIDGVSYARKDGGWVPESAGGDGWLFATDFAGVDPTGASDSTAGIIAAIAATPIGGTLVFPAGHFVITGAGPETFLITKAINILGSGMSANTSSGTNFLVGVGVPVSRDIFHVVGVADQITRGITFKNFKITSLDGGAHGQHGFHFDSTAGTTTNFAECVIENIMVDPLVSAGGYSVLFDNGVGTNVNGGIFNSTVRNCYLGGGINGVNIGDTIRIIDNIITGGNAGILISQVAGAGQIIITGNNITASGGSIIVDRATAPIIAFNQIETGVITGPDDALVNLRGPMENATIFANQIHTLAGTAIPLRIASVTSAYVEANRFSSGVANIAITAAAVRAAIGMSNLFLGAAIRLSDGGANTLDLVGEWKAYTSTFSATTGTANVTARFRAVGKSVEVNISVHLTSAVTGTFAVTLPLPSKSNAIISGKEIAMIGTGAAGFVVAGTNSLSVLSADGIQYTGSGNLIVLTGNYEAA